MQQIIDNAIVGREQEIAAYQLNIDNYTFMLTQLPVGDWPADLTPYKSTSIEALPAEMPFETVQQIADYQFRDKLTVLLRSERIEQSKAKRVLAALHTRTGG